MGLRLTDQQWEFQDGSRLSTSEAFAAVATGSSSSTQLCRSQDDPEWRAASQRFLLIGRYGLLQKLGEGTFGSVHLAVDVSRLMAGKGGRLVALKSPSTQLQSRLALSLGFERDPSQSELENERNAQRWVRDRVGQMFAEEAMLTARLATCPYVVNVLEHDVTVPLLALEYCDGGTLKRRMKADISLRQALRWAAQTCEALRVAHSLQPDRLVHRDLKPENILLHNDEARVADFGTSKMVQDAVTQDTLEGGYSPRYAAPEAFRGRAYPGTDMWSLGVILYELVAKRHPFGAEDMSLYQFMNAVSEAEPTDLASVSEVDVPPELVELVEGCLEKDPADRPSAEEATRILGALSERAHGAGKSYSVDTAGASESAGKALEPRRRGPRLALAIAALSLVVAGVGWAGGLTLNAAGPEVEVTTPADGGFSQAPVQVAGRVVGATSVEVNGVAAELSGDSFRASVELPEGDHELTILVEDEQGRLAKVRRRVRVDTTSPSFVRPSPGEIEAGEDGQVIVKVEDAHLCEVTSTAGELTGLGRGRWALTLPDREDAQEVVLQARDEAGNSAARMVVVRTPAARVSEARIREVLWDRKLWQEATQREREAAADWVAKALDGAYRRVRSETYSCGGVSHWIATFEHLRTGIKLNLIPGGSFTMGSRSGDANERPLREVTIAPLLVGVTEVTQGQWARSGGRSVRAQRDLVGPFKELKGEGDAHPMYYLSWEDATAWLRAAGDGLRLPSEAEWEYACRAGTESPWCFGSTDAELSQYAWHVGNSGLVDHPVAGLKSNAFGLYDMHGNVWEWCQDRRAEEDAGARDEPGSTTRALRSGSWNSPASGMRSAYRGGGGEALRDFYFGFRVVRSLASEAEAGERVSEQRAREILWERQAWQSATQREREAAVAWVGARLGPAYTRLNGQTYSCGGESHWIATFEHAKTGIRLNLIPGGTFLMGSESDDNERPVHEVTMAPLLVGVTELTQGQWDRIGGEDRRTSRAANRPIERVSWNGAKAWLEKAGDGLRLPSESEWEYACRAGTQSKWCFGDAESELSAYAWIKESTDSESAQDVGRKKPNAFGLYDMHGNLYEWCEDRWIDSYESGPNDHQPRSSGESSARVGRGGCWGDGAADSRSSNRHRIDAGLRDGYLGFRVARSLD